MVKRKCGNCLHYKDGGIAGSGWCQHVARRDIQHMVLVRRWELACRNGLDQDLWEPGDLALEMQPSTYIPMPSVDRDQSSEPILAAKHSPEFDERAGEMFTDRITSISMPIRSQLRPSREDAGVVAATEHSDGSPETRSSVVREARRRLQEQRHIERRKHQQLEIRRADDLLDSVPPPSTESREAPRLRAVDGPLTSVGDDGSDRIARNNRPAGPRASSESPTDFQPVEPAGQSIELSAATPRFETPIQRDQPRDRLPRRLSKRRHSDPLPSGRTEPFSTDEVKEAVNDSRPPNGNNPLVLDPEGSSRSVDGPRRGSVEPADLPPAIEPRPTPWIPIGGTPIPPALPIEALIPLAVDPIDSAKALRNVRRCCATCRSFRQVGDGRAGWCESAHAFEQRRMVESEEIACRSSLGVWWVPHDDYWLEKADTTHHGRPTPTLDEMVGAVAGQHGFGQRPA